MGQGPEDRKDWKISSTHSSPTKCTRCGRTPIFNNWHCEKQGCPWCKMCVTKWTAS